MLTLLSFPLLVATTLALPTTSRLLSRHLETRDAETWSIPTLNLHFMTLNDGLPGGGWPASQPHFNSTIEFTIDTVSNSATCHASFPNGTLPTSTFPCTSTSNSSQFSFTMSPYTGPGAGGRPELSFVLTILSSLGLSGNTPVTDDFTWSSANPLICYSGAPLDGMKCHLNYSYTIDASATAN